MTTRKHISTRRRVILGAAVMGCGASAALAQTTNITWTGTTGSYVNPNNWSNTLAPSNSRDEAYFINNNGTAQVSGTDAAEGRFLHLGFQSGDTGHLEITGGSMSLGELRVGGRDDSVGTTPGTNLGGTGTVAQSGGDVNVTFSTGTEPPIQSTYIGDAGATSGNTANGSYTISAGTLTSGIAPDDSIVVGTGSGTQGAFIQQGNSTVTSTGFVSIGRRGATGTYTMSGGTLNVGSGTAGPTMNLQLGDGANLDTSGPVAGTTGTFTQTNGTVNVKAGVEIGRRGGTGNYSISAGQLNVTGQVIIGGNGSTTSTGMLSSTGTLTLSGTGALTIGTNFNVGLSSSSVANSATGTFNMTGGSVSMTGTGAIWAIGNGNQTHGTADISGGTVTGTSTMVDIGRNSATGLLRISGTTTSVTVNQLTLNSSNPATPQTRELRLEGGSLSVGFWEQGSGTTTSLRTFNQTGGTLNVTSASAAHRGGRAVLYNFNGGTASFAGNMPFDTSTVNINGGAVTFNTLRLQSSTMNMMTGSLAVTTVNDNNGNQGGQVIVTGGTINATNWNVTNATPATPGLLDLQNGNVTIGTLTTGPGTGGTVHIAGGALNLSVAQLNLSSGTTLKTDNTVSLASGIALGNVTVNTNSGNLTLSGPVTVPSGGRTLTKTGTGTLTMSGAWTGSSGALSVAAGTLNVDVPLTAANSATVNASSTTMFRAAGVTNLSNLNVSNNATATLTADGQRTLVTGAIAITSGRFDVSDNHLVVKTTPALGTASGGTYDGVTGLIQSGRNGGAWNGSGIVTSQSTAASGSLTSIGIASAQQVKGLATASDTAVWAGATVTGSDTLVMYTYGGDANLDGKINVDDYGRIDSSIPLGIAGWYNGDFNYDGKINVDDYGIIDSNIGIQGAPFNTGGGTSVPLSAVPEPACVSLVLMAACGALSHRRRRLPPRGRRN